MSKEYDKLLRCYHSVREKISFEPQVALILGSGLGDYAEQVQVEAVLDYHDIEGFPVSTVLGHKGRFVFGYIQNVPVVICFNKTDLGKEGEAERLAGIYRDAGYDVHLSCALAGEGIEAIHDLLRGKTTALAGPSGVGKSSLTNRIQPEAEMETGAVSEKIRRGRHTTRHSELFFVEKETFVMDTPGFSSIFVDNMKPEELKDFFPEFEAYEPECRFLGCVHVGERECGVKEAVKAGKIADSRYENYRLIYEELKSKRRY